LLVKAKAKQILELRNNPGFKAYCESIQELIEAETPKISSIRDANHAIEIASKLAYVHGLRRSLMVVSQAEETFRELS
jgi:hypothetical protein